MCLMNTIPTWNNAMQLTNKTTSQYGAIMYTNKFFTSPIYDVE